MNARDFALAKLAVTGLLLCTGALAVAGVLSLFAGVIEIAAPVLKGACILAFAGMAGCSLAVAQAAASCAQVLSGDNYKGARAVAYICAVITGLVSVAGVYLGDSILRGEHAALPPVEAMLAGGFALAFIKPAMSYVITACETKDGESRSAIDELLQAKERRIVDLERQLRETTAKLEKLSPANDEAASQQPSARASERQARTVANAVRRASPRVRERCPEPVRERTERRPPLTEEEVRDTIAEMTELGKIIDVAKVAKFRNVPYSRVERSPGRRLIEALAA